MRLLTKLSLFFLAFNLHSASPSFSNTHGVGIINTPSANFLPEGYFNFNYSSQYPFDHYRFTFFPYKGLEASFFYFDVNTLKYDFSVTNQSYKDKGFSVKFNLLDNYSSKLSLGLEDFAGTGLFSSEYIVFSKDLGNDAQFTIGMGFGRLGTKNSFKNPFSAINNDFDFRENKTELRGGVPDIGKWFRGEASLFGGIEFRLKKINKALFKIEFESNNYEEQFGFYNCQKCDAKIKSNYNFAVNYRINSNIDLMTSFVRGTDFGIKISWKSNFGRYKKQEKLKLNKYRSKNSFDYDSLLKDLSEQGVLLQKADFDEAENKIRLNYIQTVTNNEKIFSDNLVASLKNSPNLIEEVILIPQNGRYFIEAESDQEQQKFIKNEYTYQPIINFPEFFFNISPSYNLHIGSPSGFVFGELNMKFSTEVVLNKNLEFASTYSYSLFDNYEKLNYDPAQTDVQPVRIFIQDYLKEGKNGFDTFMLTYFDQIDFDKYFLFSIGDFERMFGGVHGAYLQKISKYFSAGGELSYVKQRETSKSLLHYKNYQTLTGHLNLYIDEPKYNTLVKLSYGRYLAADTGFTFDISKRFKNSFRIGAYFTITNLSADQFGEGSFDKGIYVSIPLNIFENDRKGYFNEGYKPLTRDGGSKLAFPFEIFKIIEYK